MLNTASLRGRPTIHKHYWMKLASLLIGLCIVFLWAPSVEAHSSLVDSSPGKDHIVKSSPPSLMLRFSEPIEHELATIAIYDWNGKPVLTKSPKGENEKSKVLDITLPELDQGTYTVQWSIVSLDGHPVNGVYDFAVGKETEGGAATVDSNGSSTILLIITRSIVEGLLLLGAGLYWFAWLAEGKNLPGLGTIFNKGRGIAAITLVAGTIGELATYVTTLPPGLIQSIVTGRWDLLPHFPFVLMLLAQLFFLFLLIIPSMVRGWYLVMWVILAIVPSFGGHVWGMEQPFIAVIPRIFHELAISLWLGALGYFILLLLSKRRQGATFETQSFRSFFVPKVMIASGLVVVTGVIMVFMQTGWTAVISQWDSWSTLLLAKILLTIVMLCFALFQTLKWRKQATFSTLRLIRVEWIVGLIIIVLGVWMSQTAYPIPEQSYSATLTSGQSQVEVRIDNLKRGDQQMTIELPSAKDKPPEVTVDMSMPVHGMESGPFEAKQEEPGSYQVTLPFTMSGGWSLEIHATYPDGEKVTWKDSVFLKGNSSN